jgi:hypothetical protein
MSVVVDIASVVRASARVQMDAIQRETSAVGIADATLSEVLRVAQLGTTSAVDPLEVCVLLVTTATFDARALVAALVDVFGATGSVDAELCREIFGALARHDARFGGDFPAALDAGLGGATRVAHNALIELPCVKALC